PDLSLTRPRPRPALLPYTTLFRSLELAPQSRQEGVLFGEEDSLPVAFVVDGAALLWRKQESGQFVQKGNARRAEGFVLTGARAKDRKSTRLNSSHVKSSYAVFCLK